MTKWKIYNEDAVQWAKTYEKRKFHALLTDAPYNLESITKRFGKSGSASATYGRDGAYQRASKGFMNQAWDTDVAFRPETWEAFSNVLYPGAFGMAFSASRRLFIPFSGVASEMIGAGLAGWEQICGVEFDTENGYVDIAEKRLQHWLGEKK